MTLSALSRPVAALVLLLFSAAASAAVRTETITYRIGDEEFTGYLAYDDAIAGKRPGVLVVHEWWGQNAYVRKRAEMLAELGYAGFALDMYGNGKVADHPDTAKAFAQAATASMPAAEKRFAAAADLLRRQPMVDADQIAAIGYCFGGAIVLHMARSGADLDGVVSYHGNLSTTTSAQPGQVKAEVLVFTGDADPMVPPQQVADFAAEMVRAGVNFSVTGYAGAKHSFTNPDADRIGREFGLPVAYDRTADADSWSRTQEFLKKIFANSNQP